MQNEQTKKIAWEALLVGFIFSFIFLLTFRLALAQPEQPQVALESRYECVSADDCDGDGMPDDCDDDPMDSNNAEPTSGDETGCDIETDARGNPYAGDGYVDDSCVWFRENPYDGTLDDKRTIDEVESYAFNVCDNCRLQWNPGQLNTDGDALGNVCDPSPNIPNSIGGYEGKEQKDPADEEDDTVEQRDPVDEGDDAVEERDPVVTEEEQKFSS